MDDRPSTLAHCSVCQSEKANVTPTPNTPPLSPLRRNARRRSSSGAAGLEDMDQYNRWDGALPLVCLALETQCEAHHLGRLALCCRWNRSSAAAIRQAVGDIVSNTVLKSITELRELSVLMASTTVERNIPQRILQRGMIFRLGSGSDRYWAFGATMIERLGLVQSESAQVNMLLSMLRETRPKPAQTPAELLVNLGLETAALIGVDDGLHYVECTLIRMMLQTRCYQKNQQHIASAFSVVYQMCTQKDENHTLSIYRYLRDLVTTMKVVGLKDVAACRKAYRLVFKYIDRYHVPRHNLDSLTKIWDETFAN